MAYPSTTPSGGGEVPAALVRAELASILASELFVRSERLSAFLTFVVERTLAGDGDSLKEQVIALELYAKGPDFNTAADPIVRVDARRLRDRLREYYAGAPEDAVVISIPKGSYAPVFHRVGPDAVDAADAVASRTATKRVPAARWWWLAATVAVLVIVGAFVLAWRRAAAPSPDGLRLFAVTSLPGSEDDPSLSPDGRFVAFSWNDQTTGSTSDILIKSVDGDAVRNLTGTPDAAEKWPQWSPDGQWIAFTRMRQGPPTIVLVSPLGGPERIVGEGIDAAWTPDGRGIVMLDRKPDRSFGLVQHSLDTGARRTLTEAPVGFMDAHPRVSPDGKTLAFEREGDGRSAIFMMPMSGGTPTLLNQWTSGLIGGLDWMPNSRELLVAWPGPSGRRLLRTKLGDPGPGQPVPLMPYESVGPSLSREATRGTHRLAVVSSSIDVGLRLVDLKAPTPAGRLAEGASFCPASRLDLPGRFSPDGRQLAFVSDRSGSQQIWVADRDGSSLRRVTDLAAAAVHVGAWSPDGQTLVFDASIDARADLYTVRIAGGAAVRLTTGADGGKDPEWSRDGRWIYYASNRNGRQTLWKIPAGGGDAVLLTSEGGFEPRESPDGRSLVFVDRPRMPYAREVPSPRLHRVPVEGGPVEALDIDVKPGAWEMTDAGIVFLVIPGIAYGIEGADASDVLQMYDFQERRIRTLGQLAFRVRTFGATPLLTVSRDGRWLVATRVDRWERDIVAVDGFR